jgi:hypothetical protein
MLGNFQDIISCYFGIFSHYFCCDYNYHKMINSHFVKDVFRLSRQVGRWKGKNKTIISIVIKFFYMFTHLLKSQINNVLWL